MSLIERYISLAKRIVPAIGRRIWPIARPQVLQRLASCEQRLAAAEGKLAIGSDQQDPAALRLVHIKGLRLLLDPSSLVDQHLIATGDWEPAQQDYILSASRRLIQQLGREAVFLDIGAYFGIYAMQMARANLFTRIVAIEGDRRNYGQLRANVFVNSLDRRIDCIEAAVSERAEEMIYWRSESHEIGNRGGVGLVGASHKRGVTDIVKAVMVDDIVSVTGMLVVAKIDVEGHELAVIRGMKRLIENNHVFLQVECFPEAEPDHEQFLPTIGLRKVNRIESDSYWTNVGDSVWSTKT